MTGGAARGKTQTLVWGKQSAWLSAPRIPPPPAAVLRARPTPLSSQSPLRAERPCGHSATALPCSSIPNETRCAGLSFGEENYEGGFVHG